MKIKMKLLLSNVTVLVLIVLLFINAMEGFGKLDTTYNKLLNGSSAAMENLREMQYYFAGQANDERGYLLNGDGSFEGQIKEKAAEVRKISEELKGQLEGEESLQLLQQIMADHTKYTEINLRVIAEYQAGKKDAAQALSFGEGRKTRKDLTTVFDRLVQLNQEWMASDTEAVQKSKRNTLYLMIGLSAAAVLVGGAVGVMVYRSVGRPLFLLNRKMKEIAAGEGDLTASIDLRSRDEIGELAGSFNLMMSKLRDLIASIQNHMESVAVNARELQSVTVQATAATESISGSMQEVAGGAEAQLQRSEDGLRALEELAAGVQRVAGMTSEFAMATSSTSCQAEAGNLRIRETVEQMERIQGAVAQSSEVITRLGNRSEEIREIVNVITEIAGQTNLLALNASIEAARAGEHGRGFAVVANEIRRLADQTDQSVQQIGSLIDRIVAETSQAVDSMKRGSGEVEAGVRNIHETGTVFERILTEIRGVDSQIQDVSATAQEMSAISQEVTASVSETTHIARRSSGHTQHVAALTEEQLASMEEVAASAESVSHAASKVREQLGRFKV